MQTESTKKYVLKLDEKDCQIVLQALMELPFKVSSDVIYKMQQQILSQMENTDIPPETIIREQ